MAADFPGSTTAVTDRKGRQKEEDEEELSRLQTQTNSSTIASCALTVKTSPYIRNEIGACLQKVERKGIAYLVHIDHSSPPTCRLPAISFLVYLVTSKSLPTGGE